MVFVFLLLFLIFWVKVEERRRSLKELEMNGRRNINIERYSRPNKSLVLKSYLAQPFVSLFPSLSLCVFYGILHRLMVGTFLSAYNPPPKKTLFSFFFSCVEEPLFCFFLFFSALIVLSPFFCSCFLGVSYSLRDFSLPLNYAQWQQQQSVVSSIFISVRAKEF